MNIKAIVIPIVSALVLSSVYFLPEAGDMSPSAIQMELPPRVGAWVLHKKPPTSKEIDSLAKDTTFSKAECYKPRDGEFNLITGTAIPDRIDLSIVLSGHNLNDSIHRPERCMPAQGHAIANSNQITLQLDGDKKLKVQRLLSKQSFPTNEDHTEFLTLQCVTYYFFVGNKDITNNHYTRTFLDMKDRLFLGMDQRWAYISVSMWYGDIPWVRKKIPLEEADSKLKEFLQEFAEVQIDWEKIRM